MVPGDPMAPALRQHAELHELLPGLPPKHPPWDGKTWRNKYGMELYVYSFMNIIYEYYIYIHPMNFIMNKYGMNKYGMALL